MAQPPTPAACGTDTTDTFTSDASGPSTSGPHTRGTGANEAAS